MATNVFTKYPLWGDAVVGNLTTKKVQFIKADTFVPSALSSAYEMIGAVGGVYGRKVLVCYKNNAAKAWCGRIEWKLTGYTLDGTDRTGVISYRETSSATANTDVTISYNATTIEGLIAILNTAFESGTFATQNWYAYSQNGVVRIGCDWTFWAQTSNTAKSGFAFALDILPGVTTSTSFLRKNGVRSGEGAGFNEDRLYAYFKGDKSSTTYNPASDVTSVKTTYPVCLPAYLGTSQYQSDHCAFLRSVYGEGEEGFKKYLKAQMAVDNTHYGASGIDDAPERTKALAAFKYSLADGVEQAMCPAADYCVNTTTEVIKDWFLPSPAHLLSILKPVKYGTNGSRNADNLNKALWAMGGDYISNGRNYWSSFRYGTYNAWFTLGYHGFFYYNDAYNGFRALPVSLIDIDD
jgi:hypothetical protein